MVIVQIYQRFSCLINNCEYMYFAVGTHMHYLFIGVCLLHFYMHFFVYNQNVILRFFFLLLV